MKMLFYFSFMLFTFFATEAQPYGAVYRVDFTDKNGSPYSINNPQEFLTQRAIDRRTKQGIAIDESDIPVIQSYLDGITATGAVILNKSRWFNSATVLVSDTSIIPVIQALPYVQDVNKTRPWMALRKKKTLRGGGNSLPQGLYLTNPVEMLNNAFTSALLKRVLTDYGNGFNQANMIGVDYLHSQGFKGEGVVIAVLDAGFYHVNTLDMFDSLRSDGRLLGYYDFVLPGNNLFEESSHGMQVMSIMGGNVPGLLVGTAPRASYWLLRSEDASSENIVEEDNWIAAAEFADSVGADVINSSLGYTKFDDPTQSHTYSDMDGNTTRVSRGADMAASKGILVVNSAGNSGNDSWQYIGAPADADSILTIGAVDAYGNCASFSSHGPSYDGQVKPTVTAQGQGTFVVSSSDGVYPGNGTSFSSPVMAGAVACLWSANPSFSNMQVIDAVKQSASRYSTPDSLYGYGIPSMVIAHMILGGTPYEQPESGNKIIVNPNPFSDELDVVLYVTSSMEVKLSLVDNGGKTVLTKDKMNLKPGYNYSLLTDLNRLSSGVYILRVNGDGWADSVKLLKN